MNKAKPIEAGCRAIVLPGPRVHGEEMALIGCIVDVIQRSTDSADKEQSGLLTIGGVYWDVSYCSEEYWSNEQLLLRLDDPDIQHQIEQETKIPVFVEAMKRVRQMKKGSCIPKSNTAAVPEA